MTEECEIDANKCDGTNHEGIIRGIQTSFTIKVYMQYMLRRYSCIEPEQNHSSIRNKYGESDVCQSSVY